MHVIRYPQSISIQADAIVQSIDAKTQEINSAIERINSIKKTEVKVKVSVNVITKYICVHPYQYNISPSKTLLASAGLQVTGDSVTQSSEVNGLNKGIALIVTGRDARNFADNVKIISQTINHPAWVQLAILADAEAALSINKMQIPKTKLAPYWMQGRLAFMSPIINSAQILGCAGAHQSNIKNNMAATERLISIATQQKERLAHQKRELSQLQNKFSGQCYALKLSGSPSAIRKQLINFQTDNQPYASVLVLLSNDSDNLSLLYEMFSL
ncbi:hypothetical protein PVK63_06435 [Aliivibrio sp. S2TY2]|uniref:hypothetical protein n=1 Tax=unclassified Aliivibrio TaxID=2645654 RepID=UPI002379693B|nr:MULTISPECIES: hypothetical protein [unclassified Aliivibrio]MDD9174508.1 hypothetical protein [Aliivibrio sp. S3TY1]MDD9191586.1 hypothetical protein [Aliivibrio sp. S2TY2]